MTYLLDVNLILQALWVNHSKHDRTFQWLADKTVAVCPLVELGFLRISTGVLKVPMPEARALLDALLKERKVTRLADDLPALASAPKTSAQVTDRYLADLAKFHGCKLATSDGGIHHPAVVVVA